MKKRAPKRVLQVSVVLLMVAAIVVGVIALPQANAAGYYASYIEELKNLNIDHTKYFDTSVVQPLPDTVRDDDNISIIITLDETNLLDAYDESNKSVDFSDYALYSDDAKQLRETIAKQKKQILSTLDDKGISYTLGDDYDIVLCGFELAITAKDFDAVCKSLDSGCGVMVCEVYNVAEAELVENHTNVYDTGIINSSASGYDGSGMVVAVLDTGLDSNHTAFSTENFTSDTLGLTYQDVAAVLKDTKAYELSGTLSVDDVYINEKVPFGYDYADKNPDVYSTHNNHGTHVSGIIVGNDDTITGVAPNAQLVSMKIFSDTYDSAIASWILSALEDCVVLGVDVINMSLGTACGFSRESDEEIQNGVYDRIRDAGISVIVAASNSYNSAYGSDKNGNLGLTSNPDTGTVGSPGTYAGTMSVASISGTETPYILYGNTIIYFDESTNGASEENHFFETLLGDEDSKTYEYVLIPGVGRTADYTGLNVEGKIALVRRGDNTFEEKAMIAEAQGAAGIIIYNNVSGDIKMNVGDAKLAVCSISQDDGEMLAEKGSGKIKISKKQTSGPFISDFSSWGPTPSLELKPDITSFGGNILSSVTGGGYDRLSGTSMACPNMAGVVTLMRQYVVENFPNIANDNVQVNQMVNCLLMSTADIAFNTNGLPYAVRKQGAGLANLDSALATQAYITTYDKDGKVMDKSKLELGDDPEKTGVYEMTFTVNNFGNKKATYTIGSYVLTEGVSDTKTNAGETTVTEEAYALGAKVEVVSVEGGRINGKKLTVKGESEATVTVKVTLTDADKEYLDTSFANGMYVEGYITLENSKAKGVDLVVPYLAYYGDWTQAPLFDLTYYETNADELDDGIDEEDKTKADAYATRLVGGISDDYVSYLGSYYFLQDDKDMVISANEDYIALSNQEGTVHSLRFAWTGMLRNAAKIEITITDDVTGEVVFETEDTDVRKSYGDGGSIYPANVEIEFDTMEYNLANNSEYTVKLVGYLDYGDGGLETNKKNTYEFPLVIDFEAPTVTNVEFTYEYDQTLKKNRLYANVDIFDNHHAMSAQLGYVANTTDADGNTAPEMLAFEQYMTPVYSEKNSTTTVKFELTDYIYDIKENAINDNSFVVVCYDYALNVATYEIGLPTDYTDFYFDSLEDGLTMSPNEVYTMEPLITPNSEWAELLQFTSSRPGVVRVVNNKLVAVSSGKATIKVQDPQTNKNMTFTVTVLKEGDEGYSYFDKPVADIFRLTGYTTQKAYYMLDNEDKDIGDTGDKRFFEGNYALSLYPSESVLLTYDLDAFFPKDTTVEFETSNENIVTIDAYGTVTAVAEGFASVTVKVMQDGRSTYYSESVSIEVKDPYVTTAGRLTHYYGNGGLVQIPDDLMINTIDSFAFANFDYVAKTEEELAIDDRETTKQWYIGESTITKVVIPEGVKIINSYAFANLTGLEEVVFPSTLESVEYGAFYGCSALKKITFSGENNLKIINKSAFEGCALEGTIDLSSVCVISNYAFAGNVKLEGVITSNTLLSIGEYAFAGCEKLKEVTITAKKVKYGPYAFTGCDALETFYVNAAVLPEGMFYECAGMTSVKIGPDVNQIEEFAFRDTKIDSYEIADGNSTYKVQTANYILSADGSTLVAISAVATGTYTEANCGSGEITAIAGGAFSHNLDITAVEMPNVTSVGDYAFGSCERLSSVTLGELTDIGEYAFFECAITELPKFTADTDIGKYAFAFSKVTNVVVPDGMTVAEGVFAQCKSLQSVTIGNDVTLENYAFTMDKDEAFDVESYEENGKKYFRYIFGSALSDLTIGNNVVLKENVFSGHADLEAVTLGENVQIGKMAFYNCSSLRNIDLSAIKEIGDYAFSGDVYYACLDRDMTVAAVSSQGTYMYSYHAPALEQVNLQSAETIGEYAFAYCRDMKEVVLGDAVTELKQYTFMGCIALETVDLNKVETVGDYCFAENYALQTVSMPVVETIGEYAFVYCESLENVSLNAEGCTIGEAAFSYSGDLATVENLNKATEIGDYAFAYTALTDLDLSAAEKIGKEAFMKEELTAVKVTLGESIAQIGDNPFAMCKVAAFSTTETAEVNGKEVEVITYTYDISDTVRVVDGSLYCQVPNGLVLITYTGNDIENVHVAEDTVRISAMAFAGTDVQMVTMPATVGAIGHKAFFACDELHTVVFGSYDSPILEEEYDPSYYESFEHLPATGDLGEYEDYEGNMVGITGIGIVPYYMWNSTDGLYSNVFYGANFMDYVGYVDNKLTMVRPVNGVNYNTFIYGQYFDLDVVIDGAQAPDKLTLKTIAAIKAIPQRVTYEQRECVEYARSLYGKIATLEQQSLVINYADLISAEQRVQATAPTEEAPEAPAVAPKSNTGLVVAIILTVVIALAAAAVYVFVKARREGRPVKEILLEIWQAVKTFAKNFIKSCVELWHKVWPVIVAAAVAVAKFCVKVWKAAVPVCVQTWNKALAWCKNLFAKKEKQEEPVQDEETETDEESND